MLPFELSDSSLLGDIFQLALGFFKFHLEAEGVAFAVLHGRVVVRLRGVIRQGRICGPCRRGVPLDESKETKGSSGNRKKSKVGVEKVMPNGP
jgi:hypothetical protein